MTWTTPSSSLAFGMPLQPFRKDDHEMEEVVVVEDRISPIRPVWSLKYKWNGKRPALYDESPLTCRTMLARCMQRSYAMSLLITRLAEEDRQATLLRGSMRTFPARLRDTESLQEEQRLSIPFSVSLPSLSRRLPPLSRRLPQRMNMNFLCPAHSPLMPLNSHGHLQLPLRLTFLI